MSKEDLRVEDRTSPSTSFDSAQDESLPSVPQDRQDKSLTINQSWGDFALSGAGSDNP